MNKNIDRSSILQMARGAFQERVDYEMGRVVDNILDLNTKATAKRKITLTIELTPDDLRGRAGQGNARAHQPGRNGPLHHQRRQRRNGRGRNGAADPRPN